MWIPNSKPLIAALVGCAIVSCSAPYERRDPTGEAFPDVVGVALDDRSVRIPGDFAGKPTLLLIGYEMETQFDIDRWLLGLDEAKVDVPVYELPTIPGLIPGLFAGRINEGMRSGIPREDWAIVLTVYDDAATVASFLGNEAPLPARVVLLDAEGRVVFFHDRGYSLKTLLALRDTLDRLPSGSPAAGTEAREHD